MKGSYSSFSGESFLASVELYIWETYCSYGNVNTFTLAELEKLNAGSKFKNINTNYTFCKVPTLESVIELCQEKEIYIFFDLKNNNNYIINGLLHFYHKYPYLYSHSTVCSFDWSLIRKIRTLDNEIMGGLSFQNRLIYKAINFGWLTPFVKSVVEIFRIVQLYFVCSYTGNSFLLPEIDVATRSFVSAMTFCDVEPTFWVANDVRTKKTIIQLDRAYMSDIYDNIKL
ncbi:hypothetical protein A3Q56_07995 [Intoshia linei]|uniref:Uncharacterized protein n=1 Tax=Intoshia linei TaxID=1819745 RepID=A0A177AST8_9BILA|nr:hypothetical protein A3Q56_07995 [Intoshia linei]